MTDPRRLVPRTDAVLADPRLAGPRTRLGAAAVKAAVVAGQARVRSGELAPAGLVDDVLARLPAAATSLHPVLNATGVVLHTNLGRAALSDAARTALATAAGPTDVEFDLATGRRAGRGRGTRAALLAAVPDAGDALVVNNGAAALLLAITALARDREVLISRGELVEIGDGFRLPELITATGARLREVGTTNRTALADYTDALGERTGAVLKVHPANFRIEGFTRAVRTADLAGLGVPLVVDIGSGLLAPSRLLPDEPDAATALRAGADLVTASGDKLLGGPQAGLVLGRADLVDRLRRHPLARALRVDKLTLAALEATVTGPVTPTAAALAADPDELRARAGRLADALAAAGLPVEVVPADGVVGGGGAPGVTLPGWAAAVRADRIEELAAALRTGERPVVGRLEHGRLLLDPRCVPPAADGELAAAVLVAVAAHRPPPGGPDDPA